MLWLLALYPVFIIRSFSHAQNPSSNEENTVFVSNPAGSLATIADFSSVSPNTPLDDANKLDFSSTPVDDTLKVSSSLPGTTNQQTKIDVPPETNSPETPSPHTSFDLKPPDPPAFNQALIDGDIPSFPFLDLLQGIPSNINIPNSGGGSSEQKPTDLDPVEPPEPGEGQQPRYDPEERVENPTPPECGDGRFAMCCNEGPANKGPRVPLEQVWHKRRLCRLFGTNWEGCHWRQNIFCCVCKDRLLGAYGCFSPIYNQDPYYTPYGSAKRPPPPPKYFARPTVGENAWRQSDREPTVEPPVPPPQPPESMGPPQKVSLPAEGDIPGSYVWEKPDVPGRPRSDGTCTPEQLQYYKSGGTGVPN